MRYTREERAAHVELWKDSGLSKAAYSRETGVAYQSLCNWARLASQELVVLPADEDEVLTDEPFVPLPVPDDSSFCIQVCFPDNITLRFSSRCPSAQLREVLELMRC